MNINLWVTKKCNMKCSYCYEGVEKESEIMTYPMCDIIMDYINSLDEELNIRFHGGEPLLAYDIIQYFYNKLKGNRNVNTYGLTTNGLLLNDEKIEFLCNTMDDLSLSIDGGKEINDLNRKLINGIGSYDIIIPLYKKVLEKKPFTRARMTITPDTVYKLFDSVTELLEIGFRVIAIAIDIFNDNWNAQHKQYYLKEAEKLFYIYHENPQYHISIIDKNNIKKLAPCGGGYNSLHIVPNGDFYPCSFTVEDGRFKIGNIYKGINQNKVTEISDYSNIINPECNGCTMYNFCTGTQCKIINKLLTDDYNKPSYTTCMDQNVRTQIYKLN